MSDIKTAILVLSAPVVLGLGALGVAAVAADQNDNGAIRCEIHEKTTRSGVALEGVVKTKTDVAGSYRFKISASGGAGSSDINQSGDFTAGPNAESSLGYVMLGGGGIYDARLDVTIDGRTIRCSKRIGGSL